MPANLTPEYKKAEAAYRKARDPGDRLTLLREMLRTIPKHKGTEHLRADIKTKIKELTDELAGPKRTGARSEPPTVIRPEGAAQIALLGPPNTGKSTLHDRLTGSHVQTGPYPFTTQYPHPGMLRHEDVSIQLVDMPPLSEEHPVAWIANALQPADGAVLVVDVGYPGCVEQVVVLHEMLARRKVYLHSAWPADADEGGDEPDPFTVHLPTLLVATKADLFPDLEDELEVLEELAGIRYPTIAVSATTGAGLEEIGEFLFRKLEIVRVYTKLPHQAFEKGEPFTVRAGQTVLDVALMVHKDVAATLKYARLWGAGDFDGQQVGRDHVVSDGDVIELHA